MTIVMVLGLLLKFGNMSGYEIQQAMKSAKTDKWAYVQPASIYHSLRKLQSDELISLVELEHTGNRSKAIYKITAKGKKEFNILLLKSFKKSSVVFPAHLYTVLTFLNEISLDKLQEIINVERQAILNVYEEMQQGEQEKLNRKDLEIGKNIGLIFKNIYAQCELQLEFLDQIEQAFLSKK